MKQVRNTLGLWVQRIVGRSGAAVPAQPSQPPQELDAQVLTQASGGNGTTPQTPRVGW